MKLKDKNITKITKAVAGSALLVGATLAGATAVAAQSGSSGDHTLSDYPSPYVGEDGTVDASIVVGQSAKTIDVVGAVEVAGTLSQAAFTEETVSTGGQGSFGWSATDGVTLDTRNDKLFFNDHLDKVRQTLTSNHLDALEDTTHRDDSNTKTDIEFFLKPGNKQVQFGKPNDRRNQDPVLYVNNPSSPDDTDHLFRLQANLGDEIAFNSSDVEDTEITLWDKEYTVSTDTTSTELVLLGSQDEFDVQTGESETRTIDGEEHTFEVVSTDASNDQASLRVDGELRQENLDDTFTVGNQEVRIDEIINVGANDDGDGIVQFAIGTDKLHLTHNNPIEDNDNDDIDGTYVQFDDDSASDGRVDDLSSIDIYIGANDDDHEYVMAGESFSHPTFENIQFHFGGLNPDTAAGTSGTVGQVEFTTSGDDTATVDYTDSGGDAASLGFSHAVDSGTDGLDAGPNLADDDDDSYEAVEGANVTENEYFVSDAGDFAHVWEVTNVDRDSTGSNVASGDEATVDLRDAVTGQTVEVDLDADTSELTNGVYEGSEVIDGQNYYFELDADASTSVAAIHVAWGTSASEDGGNAGMNNLDLGDETTVYAAQDTENNAAVALTDDVSASHQNATSQKYFLPTTESSGSRWVDLTVDDSTGSNSAGDFATDSSTGVTIDSNDGTEANVTVNNGASYRFVEDASANAVDIFLIDGDHLTDPSAVVIESQDDSDDEHAYIQTPSVSSADTSDAEIQINSPSYTGSTRTTASLESDSDVTEGYDFFGGYSSYDSDDQGTLTLNLPDGQATAGAAFAGMDGALSSSASGGGAVTTQSPAGWPDVGMLDSDVTSATRNNQNLILVGGPAVNTLVQELADEGKTQPTSDYTEGQGMIQQIDDAFSQGNDALVVAGMTGQDTRTAANFLANYQDHQDELTGDSVTINTAQGTVVQ